MGRIYSQKNILHKFTKALIKQIHHMLPLICSFIANWGNAKRKGVLYSTSAWLILLPSSWGRLTSMKLLPRDTGVLK